ncbi:hypothetical protein HmCmsJML240_01065 [Escherichia coli]|nr:hypothetical protein HmCmsJML240_01065 [Escherichia coli]
MPVQATAGNNLAVMVKQTGGIKPDISPRKYFPRISGCYLCLRDGPGIVIFIKTIIFAAIRHSCCMDAIFILLTEINICPVITGGTAVKNALMMLTSLHLNRMCFQFPVGIIHRLHTDKCITAGLNKCTVIIQDIAPDGCTIIVIQMTAKNHITETGDQCMPTVINRSGRNIQTITGCDYRSFVTIPVIIQNAGFDSEMITKNPPAAGVVQHTGRQVCQFTVNQPAILQCSSHVQMRFFRRDIPLNSIDQIIRTDLQPLLSGNHPVINQPAVGQQLQITVRFNRAGITEIVGHMNRQAIPG